MRLGYNTNGLADHRWDHALELIAEHGYRSVALTIDHHCLSPDSPTLATDIARMTAMLDRLGLRCVIETGARFLLDPRLKHEPTLVSRTANERLRRLEFLQYAVDLAAGLSADGVSFWAGVPRDAALADEHWSRLVDGCLRLSDYAGRRNVRLAFEPEPGMLVERCDEFRRLSDAVNAPHFGLTLDVGHVHCLQDGTIADRIREFAPQLWNIHLEDMRVGTHEHLPFGAGTVDFEPIFRALRDIDYQGGVHVELSRESHRGTEMLRQSREFLRRWVA